MSSALSGGDMFGHSSTSKSVSQGSQGYAWTPEYLTNLNSVMAGTTPWGGSGFTGQGMGAFMQPNNPIFQPSGPEQGFLSNIQNYATMFQRPDEFNSMFLSPVNAAYGQTFKDVVGPEIRNYLTAQGQGDSGAYGEYASRYASSVAPQAQQSAWSRYFGGLPMLSAGLGAAAQPRLGQMQGFMNAQNIAGNILGNIPPFQGSQTFGVNRGFATNEANLTDQIGGILSIAAMLGAAA